MVKIEYIHPSMVNAFVDCPRKFKFMFVDEIKIPTIPMKLGTAFHEFAYDFYDLIKVEELKKYDDPLEYFSKFVPDGPLPFVTMCENFIRTEARRWQILRDYPHPEKHFFPVYREETLTSERLKLQTVVDRIDLQTDNTYLILEYKAAYKVRMPAIRRQWSIQYLCTVDALKLNVTKVGYYSPRTNEVYIQDVDLQMLRHLKRCLLDLRKAIDQEHFPKKETDNCFYCPYLTICSEER